MLADAPPSVRDVLLALERGFGQGARRASLAPGPRARRPGLPTGAPLLDRLIGGLPRGAPTELFGPEGAGKSTLALAWIAQAQRAGAVAAYLDLDHTLTRASACALARASEL